MDKWQSRDKVMDFIEQRGLEQEFEQFRRRIREIDTFEL